MPQPTTKKPMFPAADDPINMEVSTAKAVKAEANARTVETKRLLCAYEYDYVQG